MTRQVAWGLAIVLAGCGSSASKPPSPPLPTNRKPATVPKDAVYLADQAWRASFPVDYARPFADEPYFPVAAEQRFVEACKAGDKRSCWIAMEIAGPGDVASALALVVGNCRDGDQMSCRALPVDEESKPAPVGLTGAAGRSSLCQAIEEESKCDLAALRRECMEGFPGSCAQLGTSLPTPQDRVALTTRAANLADEGCRAGILRECELVRSFGPATQEDYATSQICELGRRFCGSMANRRLKAGDAVKGVALLEHSCQYVEGAESDCLKLGVAYLQKTYLEPVGGRGQKLVDWACARIAKFDGDKLLSREPDCKLASQK